MIATVIDQASYMIEYFDYFNDKININVYRTLLELVEDTYTYVCMQLMISVWLYVLDCLMAWNWFPKLLKNKIVVMKVCRYNLN